MDSCPLHMTKGMEKLQETHTGRPARDEGRTNNRCTQDNNNAQASNAPGGGCTQRRAPCGARHRAIEATLHAPPHPTSTPCR